MIPSVIFTICLISLIMLVWFNSDAFLQYTKLFKIHKFFKYDEYSEEKGINPYISYPLFLKMKYDNFFFKIIGCRLCMNVWLSGLAAFLFSTDLFIWIGWTSFLAIASLFIYGHVSKLLLNENK